jgi:hypothetical protein
MVLVHFNGKLIPFALAYLLIRPVAPAAFGKTHDFENGKRISPLYEEMLGNQIVSLRRELVDQKIIRAGEPFSVSSWNEDEQALACHIAAYLQASQNETGAWQCVPVSSDQAHRVVILMESDFSDSTLLKEFAQAVQFLSREGNAGFLIVILRPPLKFDSLNSIVVRSGLAIHTLMKESEIEFLKDGSGRQRISLDFPEPRRRIYERLVREGMNPVSAEGARDQAIRDFRASEAHILMVRK